MDLTPSLRPNRHCHIVRLFAGARIGMNAEPPVVDYEAKPPAPRARGMSRGVWIVVAEVCVVVEFVGWSATNGRINGTGDIAFIVTFAVIGLVALLNTIRPSGCADDATR